MHHEKKWKLPPRVSERESVVNLVKNVQLEVSISLKKQQEQQQLLKRDKFVELEDGFLCIICGHCVKSLLLSHTEDEEAGLGKAPGFWSFAGG